jgi:hypothetical protein
LYQFQKNKINIPYHIERTKIIWEVWKVAKINSARRSHSNSFVSNRVLLKEIRLNRVLLREILRKLNGADEEENNFISDL